MVKDHKSVSRKVYHHWKVRVTAKEINERWTEYFESLLNVEGENRALEAEEDKVEQGRGEEED